MLLIPFCLLGIYFISGPLRLRVFLPQPFISFALMLLDLHRAEETALNHSTTQKCNLIVAMFRSVVFAT